MVPDHLLVLGGGYIGLEFAQMFRRFGAEVTVLQRGPQLLKDEDADIADAMKDLLEAEGVNIVLDVDIQHADPRLPEGVRLSGIQAGADFRISGSHLLVATGRQPNTDMLNMEATGIELDDAGYIPVNDRLETRIEGIWAIGDVKGGPAFTHVSYDDYRILEANLFNGGNRTVSDRLHPYVVFTDPELGRVGISERDAHSRGIDYMVACMPMSSVARAIETDETRGYMKVLVDPETDRILGAAILGAAGGEIMSFLQLAMISKTPYPVLRDMVLAHPTMMESMNNVWAQLKAPDAG